MCVLIQHSYIHVMALVSIQHYNHHRLHVHNAVVMHYVCP